MSFGHAVSILATPDHVLMRKVNRWRPPHWVRLWMIWSTRGGDGWFWGLCGIVLMASHAPERFAALIAAALSAAAGILLLFRTLKKAVGRQRPCAIEPHCWATLLPPDRFSFPSGHSITAFGVAVSLGLFYPVVFQMLLFCAVSVAISRILLGMHFLTDVLAGVLLGSGLGYLSYLLLN